MKKLALFLALCLAVSSIGLTAFASDVDEADYEVESPSYEDASSDDVGDDDAADLGGEEDADLGGEEDADLGGEEDADLGGEEDADLGGEEDADLGGEEDADLGGEEAAADDFVDMTDLADEQGDDGAETVKIVKLAAGIVIYADKELTTEAGMLSEDAVVILGETEDAAAAIRYAVIVEEAKTVADGWVKAEDLTEEAEEAELKEDDLKAVAFVEIPAAEEPAAVNGEEEEAAAEAAAEAEAAPEAEEEVVEGYALEAMSLADSDNYVVRPDGTIIQYKGSQTSITLPLQAKATDGTVVTVVALDEAVFANNKSIINLTLPNNIQVDAGSFRNCTSLVSVSMHNSITTISAECFEGCTSLASVSWPENLLTIGHDAFAGCTALTGVPSGTNLQVLGDNVFKGCTALAYADMPDSLLAIGQGCFADCINLKEIIIPDSVMAIGNHAFENCSAATKLKLPENPAFTIINNYCFSNCSSIMNINVPQFVTEIGREAFYNCASANIIRLPAALTIVGDNAFAGRASSSWIRWEACQAIGAVYFGVNALGTTGYVMAPINSAAHKYCIDHPSVHFCCLQIRDFVERCYNFILNRASDETGLLSWCASICTNQCGGSALVKNFIDSTEFKLRQLNNAQTVGVLYWAMLNRAPDGDAALWTNALDIGMTTDRIIWGFTGAPEFINLCATYLMTPGSIALNNYRDQNYGITAYVSRLYVYCLGRAYDVTGLESWCRGIVTKKVTPENVAKGFFFSKEFIDQNTNDLVYIDRLYMALFGHAGDPAGINSWLNILTTKKSREVVFKGFIGSIEYELLLESFGLKKK